jgi:hypothetical protein
VASALSSGLPNQRVRPQWLVCPTATALDLIVALHQQPCTANSSNGRNRKERQEIGGRISAVPDIAHLLQKLFRRKQIGGAKSLGEAAINRRQEIARLTDAVPVTQQAGEARSSAEFPGQRTLSARPVER